MKTARKEVMSKLNVEIRRVVTSEWNRKAWRERVGVRKFVISKRNYETRMSRIEKG